MSVSCYDVVVVGAGIAGCAIAHALSTMDFSRPHKPLRVCLLERSLSEPDRIVGELLQPGGVGALTKLGMESCLDNIDAVPVKGYCVVHDGKNVQIPYPEGHLGRSFHHGKFIMSLRAKAKSVQGLEVLERTVTDLIECPYTGKVLGVSALRKDSADQEGMKEVFYADLTIIADGCFSNFRNSVMGKSAVKPTVKSHFVGMILEDAKLPYDQHGTVVLVKGHGPVLLYRIAERETRILIDVKQPLPSDLKSFIVTNIIPGLPPQLQHPALAASNKDRLRRMPNSFLPPLEQGTTHTKEGVVLLGDSWNMRHPLTGGGMTVAFHDVVTLTEILRETINQGHSLSDWESVKDILHQWFWKRKELAATVNVLSVALYDLFGANDEYLDILRTGCFKYFELGGECVAGPVGLLSALKPSLYTLFSHFFSVAFYSIWVMFTFPREVPNTSDPDGKPMYAAPRLDEYPGLVLKSLRVFWTACVVFGPLLWTEVRWTT